MLDDSNKNKQLFTKHCNFSKTASSKFAHIDMWGVSESLGVPFFVERVNYPAISMKFYGTSAHLLPEKMEIPNAGELMYLKCVQILVQSNEEEKRGLTSRELESDGTKWQTIEGYNIEEKILDIHMTLDTSTNILNLYVLATGGYDAGVSNPRPAAWPNEATPAGADRAEAEDEWNDYDYRHHTVYVSRASWKLNNLSRFTHASWN